jgi:DNA-binding response OmpR family regulator
MQDMDTEPGRAEAPSVPSLLRVLVVEDDPDTSEFLRVLLDTAGYSVTLAGDGLAALDRLDDQPPDLVLLDLLLPGMDGYTVAERIRAKDGHMIPIIMLTATRQDTSKLRAFNAGVDDFVVKPFSDRELLARISVQLRRREAMRQLENERSFLERALKIVSSQNRQTEASVEIERNMRFDLLRSVNTHLQSLCSVFEAEYRRQPPGAGRDALQRVLPRLRSAALVYQISEALTEETADFGRLLQTIATSLKSVYSPRKRIPIEVEAGELILPTEIASPLAMIANELITNAFKHAFPHSRFGSIKLSSALDGDTIYLEVIDDGVGMNSPAPTHRRGLATVRQLVASLGGTFDSGSNTTGTRVAVRIPLRSISVS